MATQSGPIATEPLVQQLARWCLEFRSDAIPAEVANEAKLLVLDTLSCAFGALEEETTLAALRAVQQVGGTPECTIIGYRERTSVTQAVFANGALVRALDSNDFLVGPTRSGHPSDNIPVALAVAERQRSSGREALAAIVLGYELYGRILDLESTDNPWDHVTTSGLVVPAMAGRLMGLKVEAMANALAFGATHCNTLGVVRGGQLSAAKSLANAMVAQTAIFGTMLAAQGLTAPGKVLEGKEGLRQNVLPGADLGRLIEPINGGYRLMEACMKAYPCIATAQAAIAAALELRLSLNAPAEQMAQIEVRMADTPFVAGQVNSPERRKPTTRETADHSFFYLVAVALLDGELTPRQFENERWLDPAIQSLMDRMVIRTDPALNVYIPGSFPALLQISTRDGRNLKVEMPYAPGHCRNRLGWPGVEAKFRRNAESVLPESQIAAIISHVKVLETLPTLAPLMTHLAKGVSL
jgi:2-methylcitrate dehydratase